MQLANDLKTNPFSFNGRSGRLNFFVYGIVPTFIIYILGFYIKQPIAILILLLLGIVLLFAAIVRRGRDAGMSVGNSIGTYILSALIISTIMDKSHMSLKLIFMFENKMIGSALVMLINNIFLVYLLFAPKSDKEVPKASKLTKIALASLGLLAVIAILAPTVAQLGK